MDFITAPLIVGICVLGIYKLFELFARRRERMAIIEKISEGIPAGEIDLSLSYSSKVSYGGLKMACLLLGLGLGLLVGFILSTNYIPGYYQDYGTYKVRETVGVIYASCMMFFGGLGLLVSFFVERNIEKENEKKAEARKAKEEARQLN